MSRPSVRVTNGGERFADTRDWSAASLLHLEYRCPAGDEWVQKLAQPPDTALDSVVYCCSAWVSGSPMLDSLGGDKQRSKYVCISYIMFFQR